MGGITLSILRFNIKGYNSQNIMVLPREYRHRLMEENNLEVYSSKYEQLLFDKGAKARKLKKKRLAFILEIMLRQLSAHMYKSSNYPHTHANLTQNEL